VSERLAVAVAHRTAVKTAHDGATDQPEEISEAVVQNPIVGQKSENLALREWHTNNLGSRVRRSRG